MVQNREGDLAAMISFPDLFKVLHKHLSGGDDVPEFFRTLMARVTELPESEWGTSKDPADRLKDNTIRTYVKRGISGKIAKNIVYNLTLERVEDWIWDMDDIPRKHLAGDLSSYDPTLNSDNVAKKVADWLVEIVYAKAGLAPKNELAKQKQQTINADLKNRFGEYLLREEHNHCAFPGCDRMLSVASSGKYLPVYEVAIIDKAKDATIGNAIAMCPRCQSVYVLDDSKKLANQLRAVKRILAVQMHTEEILDSIELEKGISRVVQKISRLKRIDLAESTMDPKEIVRKVDPDVDYALYVTVDKWVLEYYVKVREILTSLDKANVFDYEILQSQMRSMYKKLSKQRITKTQIFSSICEKIQRTTLQEDAYCQILTCYFIQSCEVFDAIA